MKTPESSNADLRKKTGPFYKKIPETGFTVDAFQDGLVEGCTAYLLAHFHSDLYARLSKTFTFPVYFSEIMAICRRANFMRENNIPTHGPWTLVIW